MSEVTATFNGTEVTNETAFPIGVSTVVYTAYDRCAFPQSQAHTFTLVPPAGLRALAWGH